jgi:hypothetical protein
MAQISLACSRIPAMYDPPDLREVVRVVGVVERVAAVLEQ